MSADAEAKAQKVADDLRKQLKSAAPGWTVTYGDVMSLLLTFFIMLYSMSELKDKKAIEIIQSFRSYFHRHDMPTKGYTLIPLDTVIRELFDFALDPPAEFGGEWRATKEPEEEPEDRVEVEQVWGNRVHVEYSRQNLRLSVAGRVMWGGDRRESWELAPEGRGLIADIAARLAGGANRIRIVGHAAPVPSSGANAAGEAGPDRVDLGWRRARAVADALMEVDLAGGGRLDPARIEVASRGASDPPPDVRDFRTALEDGTFDRVEILLTAEPAVSSEIYRRLREKEGAAAAWAAPRAGGAEGGAAID
ncbi:MAG: OmpA family protein [Planctomycetes bacterium]|nr:OmpA family protein [Planctomycetota bacterium]